MPNSNAILVNCTIVDNRGGPTGGGIALADSDIALHHCIAWNNAPREITLAGRSEPLVAYTNLSRAWVGPGNINTDPLFAQPGVWEPVNDEVLGSETNDPNVVWIAGDHHLQSRTDRWDSAAITWTADAASNRCIDAGDPDSSVGQECPPNGARVNMGAYGATAQARMSS